MKRFRHWWHNGTQVVRTRGGRVALTIGLVGVGGIIGAVGNASWQSSDKACFSLILDTTNKYAYIRPLLLVRTPATYLSEQYAPLRTQIEQWTKTLPPQSLTRYSVYFRSLTDASSFGINEQNQYDPGSMLKVVVALAVYKQAERHPGYLTSLLTYTPDVSKLNATFSFAPPVALTTGGTYDIPYLLKIMLSDSDNAAKDLLLSSLDQSILDSIYDDLRIQKPNDADSAGYTITPVEYSRFLRVLYYGTYNISWENDNLLLKLLSQSTYTDGLVAGVPKAIPIAHKFGERVNDSSPGGPSNIELSDCGIVYHPTRPYLLCVMTEGDDQAELGRVIAHISADVYAFIDRERGE